jgi:hypothetical protein
MEKLIHVLPSVALGSVVEDNHLIRHGGVGSVIA